MSDIFKCPYCDAAGPHSGMQAHWRKDHPELFEVYEQLRDTALFGRKPTATELSEKQAAIRRFQQMVMEGSPFWTIVSSAEKEFQGKLNGPTITGVHFDEAGHLKKGSLPGWTSIDQVLFDRYYAMRSAA